MRGSRRCACLFLGVDYSRRRQTHVTTFPAVVYVVVNEATLAGDLGLWLVGEKG